MKLNQYSLLIWNFIICLGFGSFLINPLGYCEEIENLAEFRYEQKPISKVTEKNFKFRVAISRFEEETEIKGSPFNIKKDEKKESYETAIDVEDSEVTIKIDDEIKKEEELSKAEILTGLFTDALRKTEMFEVVERKEINELIREINFQNSNWVKKENINTLGNIFGVQYILTGEILRNKDTERISKDRYTLALRMYNVNTGEIISSSTASHSYLRGAVGQAMEELSASIKSKPWTCRIVGIDNTGIYINAGLRDDLEKRDTFYIYRIGEKIIDPETREILGFSRKKIALIKVEEVLADNLSRAKTVEGYEKITIGDIVSA
ncbi:MAG: CsgG/HfaB family protein, partial [Nanoarchaeota archaeon]|nr:CsgG/HfaB family protein [Nanoarchaeota archaeon]